MLSENRAQYINTKVLILFAASRNNKPSFLSNRNPKSFVSIYETMTDFWAKVQEEKNIRDVDIDKGKMLIKTLLAFFLHEDGWGPC